MRLCVRVVVLQDGKGVTLDPLQSASDCGENLRSQDNLRTPPVVTPGLGQKRRFQFLADGVGFYRAGRMATRVGLRCMDAIRTTNSRFFFWSCAIFLNHDHYEELKHYITKVLDSLNAGLIWTKGKGKDEWGAHIEHVINGEACVVCDGGDAAAANALAGLEPPPSKHGCCTYCELRRKNWFDAAKTKAAPRRNFFRSCLMAHVMPPGSPTNAKYKCPRCPFVLTHASCAAALLAHNNKSDGGQTKADVKHRNAHFGQHPFKRKLLHSDHKWRVPSLLHLILNTTATTMTVVLDAGSTKPQRIALNEILHKHGVLFRFKETKGKGDRPKKAVGNDCRLLLWKPELFLELLATRWGAPKTPEEMEIAVRIQGAQAAAAPLNPATRPAPAHAPAANPGVARTLPGGPRRAVVNADIGDLGDLLDGIPPTTTPAPPPPPPPPPNGDSAAHDADDCPDSDDDEVDGEVDLEDSDDLMPEVGEIAGNHRTALRSYLALLELQRELHSEWVDEDESAERKRRAAQAQKLGAQWASNIRAHATESLGHYYMHLCAAHLEELILLTGNMQSGNDEILEAGNYTMKKYRDLTWKGSGEHGVKKGQELTVTYPVQVVAEGGSKKVELRTKKRARNSGAELNVLRMEVAGNLINAKRQNEAHCPTAAVQQAKKARSEVKREGQKTTMTAVQQKSEASSSYQY